MSEKHGIPVAHPHGDVWHRPLSEGKCHETAHLMGRSGGYSKKEREVACTEHWIGAD